MRANPSLAAVTSRRPSGLTDMSTSAAVAPTKSPVRRPEATSHERAVPSWLAATTARPPSAKRAASIFCVGPVSACSSRPEATSHRRTTPSPPAVRAVAPSRVMSTARTSPSPGRPSAIRGAPVRAFHTRATPSSPPVTIRRPSPLKRASKTMPPPWSRTSGRSPRRSQMRTRPSLPATAIRLPGGIEAGGQRLGARRVGRDAGPGQGVEHEHRAVGRARDDARPARAGLQGEHDRAAAGRAVAGRPAPPAGHRVPAPHAPVPARRDDHAVAGGEDRALLRERARPQHPQLAPGAGVPDAVRAVGAGRDHPRAVRAEGRRGDGGAVADQVVQARAGLRRPRSAPRGRTRPWPPRARPGSERRRARWSGARPAERARPRCGRPRRGPCPRWTPRPACCRPG